MSQITRCPSCATSFKVVPDQLRISEGWVRCGHCQNVFDATQHLQAASQPPAPAAAQESSAPPAPTPTAGPEPALPAIDDPWEIPLPPPPAPPGIESAVATPLDDALDLSTAAPIIPNNIDLDWPEVPSPAAAPAPEPAPEPTAPPPPAPAPLAPPPPPPAPIVPPPPPAAVAATPELPTPIPAASIPTDIDWPEPALEFDADQPTDANLGQAIGSSPNAGQEDQLPVMPELDLAPDLAPPPTAQSFRERIEPSGPVGPLASLDDWATGSTHPPTEPPEADPSINHPKAPAVAPAPAAANSRSSRRKKGRETTPAPAPSSKSKPHPADTESDTDADVPASSTNANDEPSFVRAARRQALWRTPSVRIGLVVSGLLLLLTLAGQMLVHDRHRLAASQPSLRPMLELLCSPFDCTVGLHRQIASVVVESSAFNRVDGGVYHFSITLKNRSDLILEMPAVELTLTDANEQAVLRRVFTPQELSAGPTLAPHAEFSSTLLVRITTTNAPMAGYRILAFYP